MFKKEEGIIICDEIINLKKKCKNGFVLFDNWGDILKTIEGKITDSTE